MKLFTFLIAFSWLASLIFPWWIIFITCFISGLWLGRKNLTSFYIGFIGIALIWLVHVSYIHIANQGILTDRINDLFGFPHPVIVIILTLLTGGIMGGFSTLTGNLLRQSIN